jgi:hypothetical protein
MKRKPRKYDPDRPLDTSWWTSHAESEQIALVEEHHRRAGIKLPRPRIHAATHVIVENQILLADETPVAATLERLLREGLSRHDAIHAIGSVLAPVMVEIMQGEVRADPNIVYYQRLRELTAEDWLAEFS